MFYTLVRNGEEANITVFIPGHTEPYQAHSSHPNFDRIVDIVVNEGDEDLLPDLFSVEKAVAKRFESLSERVAVRNGQVYFDGDVIDNALTKQIVRFLDEDVSDWEPLVLFMEKVESNPQEHSREQLYRWLDRHDFTITPAGDFVGYKGVRDNGDGDYVSINRGPAIVDGQEVNGAVPNYIGATVEIARSYVEHNPGVGCARGLHVGTYKYASGWAQGALLEVHVNPRDVVSVPTDCDDQKVRTCRYVVVDVIEEEYTTAVTEDAEDDDFDWLDDLDFLDDEILVESGEEETGEVTEEPKTDANGFKTGDKVRVTEEGVDLMDHDFDPETVGTVAENDNGLSSLTKVVWPNGDDDLFYGSEIQAVVSFSPNALVFPGGFETGDKVRESINGETGVVTDDENALPEYIPVKHDNGEWLGYYEADELSLIEEQVTYHGHVIGERWQQPDTGIVFRVCLRPTNPDEYGFHEDTVPVIRESNGTHDAVSADSLHEVYGWRKLS